MTSFSGDYPDSLVAEIIQYLNLGIVLIESKSQTVRYVNPVAEKLIGLDAGEILGRRCHRFICPSERGACPVLDRGRTVDNSRHVLLRANGERFDILKTASPITWNGEHYLLESFFDLSGLKSLAAKWNEDLSFIQTLMDSLPVPVFYKNTRGVYLGCNERFGRQVLGMDREAIIGKTVFDLASPELARDYERMDRELFENPPIQTYEASVRFAEDGTEHRIRFYKAVYEDRQKCIAGLIGVMLDITDLRETEKELKAKQNQLIQADKMASIGQLAAGVAHEINNPIGFITSNLHTLKEYTGTLTRLIDRYVEFEQAVRDGDEERIRGLRDSLGEIREEEDLEFIREDLSALLDESVEGTSRVKEIVQNLKTFARVDDVQVKEADVNELIESTLKIVWNELKYKCVVVKNYGKLPRLRCYPQKLNQVFMNLLVNAAQAIPEKGEIRIETAVRNEEAVVWIQDNGSGIPADRLSRIFEPFFTTKPVGKGTGLGLSISYGIIRNHGGKLDVESEPGRGTCFVIRLPLSGMPEDRDAGPA
jgi:PAS domain S-box-containing protein